ncbi:PAS domain-containing sensor histidine kinase [Capnocytophaga sp. oral taxon 878]|uniref:sensor histidine kinase n=1 Tax=Capnocytophaga sp. oral taxon 878 TaxID=1316596 RepID=UPI000D040AFF|nr:HAMP domain-containing sensor histidine kinase [Capnocytophaga sp. oral taxon 878]AVM51226.1 two-component sensor histidine kinase [Capnocytophaga sp. oral taxon 878]
MFKKNSLRFQIFLSMTLLVLVAFAILAFVMVGQYRKQALEYHDERLIDKENQIKMQIQYVFSQTTFPVETIYIPLIFREDIYSIANIQNLNFALYDLDGVLLKSSKASLSPDQDAFFIPQSVLSELSSTLDKRIVEHHELVGRGYQTSYTYITDLQFKPIAILNIPYFENDTFNERALEGSLYRLSIVYFTLLVISLTVAYFISKYITKSLKTIESRLQKTRLLSRNEKITLKSAPTEITELVTAYNAMIDEIENSKALLAKSEREQAWRDMAKQVAHEIKNPLTPMRLSVQSYQRKANREAQTTEDTNEFCESLIQQIDILSNISTAFSALTNMPAKNDEELNFVAVIKRTLDIFNDNTIQFNYSQPEIIAVFDKDQLGRVVTNLVKNAIQATENESAPQIEVALTKDEQYITLKVTDNGIGIAEADHHKIFEPKFTTKTSGSGLGLAMVKNIILSYNGNISFTSELGKGSEFVVQIPVFQRTN